MNRSKIPHVLLTALLTASVAPWLQAQIVWTGASSSDVSDLANWSGATAISQALTAGATLTFPGGPARTSIVLDASTLVPRIATDTITVYDLIFTGSTASYSISGSGNPAILFSNGVQTTTANANPVTFASSLELILNGEVNTFDTAAGSEIKILSNISGNYLAKTGAGTLTLGGANTFTGATTIDSGTLEISSLTNGGTASGIGASASSAANLILNGGTLRYVGDNGSTDRLFTLGPNGGTLDASSPTFVGGFFFTNTGSIAFSGINTSPTLTLTGTPGNTSTAYFYPQIGDNGTGATPVHLLNGSFWRLAAANTYSGGTTIDSGGTLVAINSAGSATGTGVVTINSGGRLVIGSNSPSGMIGGNIVNNGQIEYNRSDDSTYSGVISGSGILWDGMPNQTFTLTGANTFTGATTIYGTVAVTSLANGGIGASTNAAANLVLNGGTLRYLGGTATTDRLFTLGTSGGTLDSSGTGSLTFANTGSVALSGTNTARTFTLTGSDTIGAATFNLLLGDNGTGATSLVKNGNASWVLTGANTYSGGTTINGGTLIATNSTGSATGSAAITINTNGALQIGSGGTAGSVSGNIDDNGALYFNHSNALTYSGVISGSGALWQNGSGTLTLSGANTYSGATNLTAGSLSDAAANRFSPNSAIYINAGRNLNASFAETIAGLSDYTPGTAGTVSATATLTINNAADYTFSGAISGAGALVKGGLGIQTLGSNNTYTGVTTINGGILAVYGLANGGAASGLGASSNAAANLVLNGGTLRYLGGTATTDRLFTLGTAGGTLDASSSGTTGPLTFSNTGSIVLSGTNTTRTLTLTGSNNTDVMTLTPVLGDNGTGATSLVKSGAATWKLGGANTYSGGTTINGGILIAANPVGTGSATGSGVITVNASGTLQIGTGGTAGLVSGNIVNNGAVYFSHSDAITYAGIVSGAGSLVQNGSGTLTLGGANNYSGSTLLTAGSLSDAAANRFSPNSVTYINAGRNLDVGFNETVAGLGDYAPGIFGTVGVAATLTLNATQNYSFSGAISGAGSLVKSGVGTQTLAGANTYTGGTNVDGGTLAVDGGTITHPASNVQIAGGDGQSAALTITNGGSVSSYSSNIGYGNTSTGMVTIDGAGSSWSNSSVLTVGGNGNGILAITHGGGAVNSIGSIAYGAGTTSAVSVTGSGSHWDNTGEIYVGGGGNGSLVVGDQGAVTSNGGYIGLYPGSTGVVTIDGAGSTWTNSADLVVGNSGAGALAITNGALGTSSTAHIGFFAGSMGAATIDGLGSTWANSGLFEVGFAGTGALTLSNGGTLNVNAGAGTVFLGSEGGLGLLNIGPDEFSAAAAGGVVDAATITTGAGAGEIQFNTTATSSSPYYLTTNGASSGTAVTITGPTQIVNTAGYNVLTGPTPTPAARPSTAAC